MTDQHKQTEPPEPKIVECMRCKAPQLFNFPSLDSEIPVALALSLDGGYAMFVDNIYTKYNPLQYMLCHPCAHEFTKFMNIPEETVTRWHPKTDESYCNGWTIIGSMERELEMLKERLSTLIYMNEETMIEPFEDYTYERRKLEELIQLQEERITNHVSIS
jgi:hypothetical protein